MKHLIASNQARAAAVTRAAKEKPDCNPDSRPAAAVARIIASSFCALASATPMQAQTAPAVTQLPSIEVTAPEAKRRARRQAAQNAARGAQPANSQTASRPQAAQELPKAFTQSHDARTGTVGIYAESTSSATKTNTPLINIPQAVTVVTKEFIKDQNYQSLTDVTRYVPGVAVHQGEGNRDELVIRSVNSSANFFVNGFRDDVQYYRDLYNTQSLEVLKGPSALIFGRGS